MILTQPCCITPRLLPGVRVGGAFISIEYSPIPGDETRTRYRYHVDGVGEDYTGDDLQSGNGGGSLQEGLALLLCFMGDCGESVSYSHRTGSNSENCDLFPERIAEWCAQNSDELSMLTFELEEGENVISE